jgi:hypothetical protein
VAHRRGDGGVARRRRASGERGSRGGMAAVRPTARSVRRSGRRWHTRGGRAAGARLGREAGDASEAVREAGGASEAGCQDARRAVPTAALSRGVGAVRGSHAATARCRAGPVRRAASDKWGALVSDF